MPRLMMYLVLSLSVLVVLFGMYIPWKYSEEIQYAVAIYDHKDLPLPDKYQGFWSSWIMSILLFFFQSPFQGEELSFQGLLRARKHLERRGRLSEQMNECFINLIEALDKEPHTLLKNAKLTFYCDGILLEFASGKGENEIVMYESDGQIFYKTKESTWAAYLIKVFRKRPETN